MTRAEEIRLAPGAPFHLEATVRLLQRRPVNRVDRLENGRYQRLLQTRSGPVAVTVENRGTVAAPDLRATFVAERSSAALRTEIAARLRRMLGLDVAPGLTEALARHDPRLRDVARQLAGMRPPRFPTLFEAFANIIPFQQVSLDSGAAVVARLVERLGTSAELDGARWFAFPTAAEVERAGPPVLRELGLSRAKAHALHGIASRIAEGSLTEAQLEAMPNPEVQRRLMELPGIGPWSAGLVLLRGLGRIDSFPVGDVGVARGLAALLGEREGFDHEAYAARFGELRGLLYYFSLGAQLLARDLIHPAA